MENAEQLTSVNTDSADYVTVVSVGSNEPAAVPKREVSPKPKEVTTTDYVTVLKIGNDENCLNVVTEEAFVYRLPGEKLGFGLKFEGGTKSDEFVKRLFIQSCALNSPASRVQSSWGSLTEGDEVLEIDSIPVNSMTRIDCVRCLKNSNVVIKLLIKHRFESNVNANDETLRLIEDLPLVVSAEKKRTPPPPPPVPPRKVNRKNNKDPGAGIFIPPKGFDDSSGEVQIQRPNKYNHSDVNSHNVKTYVIHNRKSQTCPSPKSVKRRDVVNPPDAEIYTDLFTQESTYSLSESDDTGSSISTVVDRLSSFPTTTNSSFAGSLPSTPTPVQRHVDLIDDIDFSSKLSTTQDADALENSIRDRENFQKAQEMPSADNAPLQPPASFQDAPLSYGNEHVPVIKQRNQGVVALPEQKNDQFSSENFGRAAKRPPPPPPRNKNQVLINLGKQQVEDTANYVVLNLPRLVDFVPKSTRKVGLQETQLDVEELSDTADIVARFLESEKRAVSDLMPDEGKDASFDGCVDQSVSDEETWNEEAADVSTFGWNLPSKLATIGEDEEEAAQPESLLERRTTRSAILVITTENKNQSRSETTPINLPVLCTTGEKTVPNDVAKGTRDRLPTQITKSPVNPDIFDVDAIMENPPIYSRQPPDGHEFPDYQEVLTIPVPTSKQLSHVKHRVDDPLPTKNQADKSSVRDKIAIFSNSPPPMLTKRYVSTESLSLRPALSDSLGKQHKTISKSAMSLDSLNEFSSSDVPSSFGLCSSTASVVDSVCGKTQNSTDLLPNNSYRGLHVRSQSLTNMTVTTKQDRWNLLVEQRRKGLSKLKDLVIPEHVSENDNIRPVIDLPEIRSNISPSVIRIEKNEVRQSLPVHVRNSSTSSLTSPLWHSKTTEALPKYSPAFKRKSLQIYGSSLSSGKETTTAMVNLCLGQNHTFDFREELTSKSASHTVPKTNEVSRFDVNTCTTNESSKSLESITSPTRSDYSFEYVSSPEFRQRNASEIAGKFQNAKSILPNETECVGKSEDDSDSDSALSSSQSSYVSKNSSSGSSVQLQIECAPHALCNVADVQGNERHCERKNYQNSCHLEIGNYDSLSRRLLKPQSVEAINRKNILASARCRSGMDLKVGSPLIQRKFDEDVEKSNSETASLQQDVAMPSAESNQLEATNISKEKPESNDASAPKNYAPEVAVHQNNNDASHKNETRKIYAKMPIINANKKLTNASKSFGQVAASTSVTDLRKNFEKVASVPPLRNSPSLTTNSNAKPANERLLQNKRSSLPLVTKTTSVKQDRLSEQVTETIIDKTLKEFGDSMSKDDLKVIVLKPEIAGGSLGITLAGGADYETKEITVHKIRNGSLAFKDGRLRKGDKILSINGKYMKGLSHGESLAALKESVPEVIIVACNGSEVLSPKTQSSFSFQPPTTVEGDMADDPIPSLGEQLEVRIEKDAAGLGFSIQGGKGSVSGDVPLVIKKLFMGGPAERSGKLIAGDELLEINRISVAWMSRIDAWNLMKKLPEGEVSLLIRR